MSVQSVSESEVVVPVVERIAAVMQVEPELWVDGVLVHFHSNAVSVGVHDLPWDAVHELLDLLDVEATVRSAFRNEDSPNGEARVYLCFGDQGWQENTVSLTWFTSRAEAELAFGLSRLACLLGE